MTASIQEQWSSRKGKRGLSADNEVKYVITDTDDDDVAHDLLDATVPSTWDGNELDSTTVEQIAGEIFIGTAKYIDPERRGEKEEQVKEVGETSFNFRTGGGTEHITHGKLVVHALTNGPSAFPVDFGTAIGVQGDSIQGCDIVVPVMEFQVEKKILLTALEPFAATIYALTGKTNNATFMGFNTGEVLFKGASGSRDGKTTASITFDFAASPNTTVTIPGSPGSGGQWGDIGPLSKGGWDYIWVHYVPAKDTQSNRKVQRPHSAYVIRVYDSGDFSALGL